MTINKWRVNKEIRVFGMQRSGNHAIINWIIKQQKGHVLFLNHGDPLAPFNKHRDYQHTSQTIDLFLHSYEDYRLSPQLLKIANTNRTYFFDPPQLRFDILILRDPLNLFASRLRSGYTGARRNDRYSQTDLWVSYAEEYIGKTNNLALSKVLINYNQWCVDQHYRKKLAERLQINFTDVGFDDVPVYGGGSSFEGRDKNGHASTMDTSGRWKHYVKDARFIAYFHDPRILKIGEKIYGQFQEANKIVRSHSNRVQRAKGLARGLAVKHAIFPLIDFRLWLDRKHFLVSPENHPEQPSRS